MRRDIADIKDALSGKSAGVLLDLPPKTRELQKIIAPPIRDEEMIESEPEPEAVQDYTVNPNKLGEVSLAEVERELIEKTLKKFHHKKRQTANALKISERTLYRKIKEYGL